MKSDFKLIGMGKQKSMTCEPLNNENIFWPKVDLTQDRFNALWDYKEKNWADKMIAIIRHDGIRPDGTPINGVVVALRVTGDEKKCPECGSKDVIQVHNYYSNCVACGYEFV